MSLQMYAVQFNPDDPDLDRNLFRVIERYDNGTRFCVVETHYSEIYVRESEWILTPFNAITGDCDWVIVSDEEFQRIASLH